MQRMLLVVFLCVFSFGFSVAEMAGETEGVPNRKIVINIPNRSLSLYVGGERKYLFPVGVGKTSSKTPLGEYSILAKEINPVWIKPDDEEMVVASGPENPLGYRWLQFKGLYGIHGTNRPESIGGYVSNGCIRMKEADVELLYDLVPVGTPVEIIYSRLVIEKNPEKIITYYIYPDTYGYQPLDVEKVNNALANFGLAAFVPDENIAKKIAAEDGRPTYIARAVRLVLEGKPIDAVGAVADNMVYLPAEPIAEQLGIALQWEPAKGRLSSAYGTVAGYAKKGKLYFNAMEAAALFGLERDWKNPELLYLNRLEKAAPVSLPPAPPTIRTADTK